MRLHIGPLGLSALIGSCVAAPAIIRYVDVNSTMMLLAASLRSMVALLEKTCETCTTGHPIRSTGHH
jgi:hypothetical protein